MQRTVNVYLTIRCTVDVSDDTSVDEIVSRVAECCDYSVEHEDDVCVITDTCILDADSVASTI